MSRKWQSQQCVLLQGSSWQPQGLCHSQEVAVYKHGLYTRWLLWLSPLWETHSPSQEWAVFQVSPRLTFMAPHLCMKGQNCCRNRRSTGVPVLNLLLPLANVFSVSRPDHTSLFTKARGSLTVNSLRKGTPFNSSSYHPVLIPSKGTDTANTLCGKPWSWAYFKLK